MIIRTFIWVCRNARLLGGMPECPEVRPEVYTRSGPARLKARPNPCSRTNAAIGARQNRLFPVKKTPTSASVPCALGALHNQAEGQRPYLERWPPQIPDLLPAEGPASQPPHHIHITAFVPVSLYAGGDVSPHRSHRPLNSPPPKKRSVRQMNSVGFSLEQPDRESDVSAWNVEIIKSRTEQRHPEKPCPHQYRSLYLQVFLFWRNDSSRRCRGKYWSGSRSSGPS